MTTPDTATVPPERCPICGETAHQVFSDRKGPWGRRFACGADWLETGKWYAPCKYAMDAALRCGATLEPTPREVAREKVLWMAEKLVKRLRKYKPLMDVSELVDDEDEDSDTIDLHMDSVLFISHMDDYRATDPHHPYPSTHQENP